MLSVVDLSKFEVEIKVPESFARDLGIGMPAQLTSGNGEPIRARCRRSRRKWSTAKSPRACASADKQPPGLRQNQRLSARIVLDTRRDVLQVERGPFVDQDGGRFAYVMDGSTAVRRPIRTGVTASTPSNCSKASTRATASWSPAATSSATPSGSVFLVNDQLTNSEIDMNADVYFPSQLNWTAQELAEAVPLRLHELFAFDAGRDVDASNTNHALHRLPSARATCHRCRPLRSSASADAVVAATHLTTGIIAMLDMRQVTKVYRTELVETHALRALDLHVREGEFVAVTGPSGSGKTTFLNIAGLLDSFTGGEYRLDGEDVRTCRRRAQQLRNQKIGFIFQSFNLIPT